MFKSQNKKFLVNFTPHSKKEKENFLSAASYNSPGWAIIMRWFMMVGVSSLWTTATDSTRGSNTKHPYKFTTTARTLPTATSTQAKTTIQQPENQQLQNQCNPQDIKLLNKGPILSHTIHDEFFNGTNVNGVPFSCHKTFQSPNKIPG